MVTALLISTRMIARMIFVPNRFLGAFILILAFDGVPLIRNNFADCAFAAGFGFLGFILRRLDWPLFPLVLGMVLGSIMVEKLTARSGKIRVWTDLVDRPVSGFLAVIVVLMIIATAVSLYLERRHGNS